MAFTASPLLTSTLRYYSQRTAASKNSVLGIAATIGYCCVAFSAPFAGAAVVSRRAAEDARYAKLYVSSSPCLSPDR